MKQKIQRYYVSEVDKFLINFDKEHPTLSASQKKEVEKYKQVYELRDHQVNEIAESKMWDKF